MDFALQFCTCDTHAKWYQIISELEGIPLFCYEFIPTDWEGSLETERTRQLKSDYATAQMLEAIDWMIKITGKEFDDEKFIEGVLNEFDSTARWARVCELNRAIPAPLDEKSMFSLYVLQVLARPRKEVADFYGELLAEVEERVENQIAANPNERCRLISDCQPPWHALGMFRTLESYGVVSVGAHYSMALVGGWEYSEEEDTWHPARTPQEKGIEIKTREDAVRALVDWFLDTGTIMKSIRHNGAGMNKRMLDMVDKWHAQGVLMHLNRGCEGIALGQMEVSRAVIEAGIPILTYEGNMADPREFDEPRTLARIESFMETLGLQKIVED